MKESEGNISEALEARNKELERFNFWISLESNKNLYNHFLSRIIKIYGNSASEYSDGTELLKIIGFEIIHRIKDKLITVHFNQSSTLDCFYYLIHFIKSVEGEEFESLIKDIILYYLKDPRYFNNTVEAQTLFKLINEADLKTIQVSDFKLKTKVKIEEYLDSYVAINGHKMTNYEKIAELENELRNLKSSSEYTELLFQSPIIESTNNIGSFSSEQIDILKSYFIPAFKGMGKGINYFDENLLTDLKKSRTGKEYAVIAKLIQESPKVLPVVMKKSFKKWLEEFCLLIGIVNTQYKPSQLEITDTIRSEFYYLA